MSSTFTTRTYLLKTTGSAMTFPCGFEPSFVEVLRDDGVEFKYAVGMPTGTTKIIAAGTRTMITTTGITFDTATKSVVLGTDAALAGTADKTICVRIFK